MLTNIFSETVKALLSKDEAYQFMGNIKGTLDTGKKFYVGLPTLFMALSCADWH